MSVRLRHLLSTVAGNWILLTALVVAGAVYAGGGAGRERQVALLFIYIVLVVGLQIFVGNSGVFSLGHMAVAGVGGYTAAILTAAPATKAFSIPDAPLGLSTIQLGPLAGTAVAVLVAVSIAALIGLAVTRLSGLAAIIVTLAVLVITESAIVNFDTVTGGSEAFFGYPIIGGKTGPIAAAFLAVTAAGAFRYSRLGLRLQASREDELAAAATGIGITATRLAAWVVSSAVVALGGVLLTFFVGTITPGQFSLHLTLLTLAMLVLGGMKSVGGAIAGAVVVFVGSEVTRFLADGPSFGSIELPQMFGLTTLFLGAVLLVVMIRRPGGLTGDRELGHLAIRQPRFQGAEAATEPAAPHRLTGDSVRKAFSGLTAVDSVDVCLRSGEIVGLIGPNGAGKTTLLNMISGVLAPTSGSIRLDGVELGAGPTSVARNGVARTFQNIRLFDGLTVWENVDVADSVAVRHRPANRRFGTDAAIALFDLEDVAMQRAGETSYGRQRHLELARAVALAPDLLLLDEPSAGLNDVETAHLMDLVAELRDAHGLGILVVDHDLAFIMSVCERIYVMDQGHRIAAGTPDQVREDPAVVAAYLGRRPEEEQLDDSH